jgi:hypothetical protein
MKKILIPLIIIAVLGFARTAYNTYPPGHRSFQIITHNINQVEMSLSNYGKFGQTSAGTAGCWWPKGSGQNYIFGAGPWFGTIDETTGDTLVTIGYGPHGGETEYGPGLSGWTISDPNAIIFLYPTTWPPPAASYPMAPQSPKSHQDSWCAYNDLDATYHMAGDTRPIGLEVYQTVYAWNLTTTQNIIFIRYEFKNVSGQTLNKCFFGVCTDNDIGNESGTAANDIISGIVGQWYRFPGSPDSIWVDNLGYQWQTADEAGWTPPVPGAIGFDYLQSPYDLVVGEDKDHDSIPDQYERDSAYFAASVPVYKWDVNGNGVPDWRDPAEIPQYGMSAFKRFTLNLEPNRDNERYVTMAGFNFKTGAYEPFDTVPPAPDDQRFLQVSGPFSLLAESTTTVLVGIIFATWDGVYATPDSALVEADNTCQFIYDMNWLLPGPPPPPMLTCIPGDKKVTLIWNNLAENTPDPYYDVVHFAPPSSPIYDPYYLQYDFQGFRIWKSLTGQVSSWSLLGTYDKADGNTFTWEDAGTPESLWIAATDNGLVHSFLDPDVRNGFNYYYAVTAFDLNYVKSVFDSVYLDTTFIQYDSLGNPIDTIYDYDTIQVIGPGPLCFESGQTGINATPRRDPANYVASQCARATVFGNPALADTNVGVAMNYPFDMTSDSLFVDFLPTVFDSATKDPLYTIYLRAADHAVVDSVKVIMDPQVAVRVAHQFALYKGMNVTGRFIHDALSTQSSIFDRVEIQSGTYSLAKLTFPNLATWWNFWAYRGSAYQVTWKNSHGATSGPANTVDVLDLTLNQVIPYKAYKDTVTGKYDNLAEGWTFMSQRTVSDTIIQYGSNPTFLNTRAIYVMGGKINLKNGGQLTPSDTLPQVGDVWLLVPNPNYNHPAPAFTSVALLPSPAYLDTVTKLVLNVKVVPNPYIVHNEWQRSSLIRRMRFINLPGRCTIRIFNLNGELVKTLLHTETITPETGSEVKNNAGGDEWWDLLSENRQLIASGVYVFHIESNVGEQVGKFAIVR